MYIKRVSYVCLFITISILVILELFQLNERKKITRTIKDQMVKQEKVIHSLTIPKLNLTQIIVFGATNKNLDKNYIVTNDNLKQDRAITLYGHSVKNVFGNIKYLKKGDQIYLDSQLYLVMIKKIIDEKDFSSLETENNYLNLVTCVWNQHKRLLIIARKK